MVDVLRVVVLSFKFDQNLLSRYRDVTGQNLVYCTTLANTALYDSTGVIGASKPKLNKSQHGTAMVTVTLL